MPLRTVDSQRCKRGVFGLVSSHNRDELSGLIVQSIGQLFIVCDQVGDVDVAVVLLRQDVFADLVAVNEDIVEHKVEKKVDQLFLRRLVGGLAVDGAFAEQAEGIRRLAIHRCGGVGGEGGDGLGRDALCEQDANLARDARDE